MNRHVLENLRRHGVLGINERIGVFMNRYNERRYYPLVDDKWLTSVLMDKAGIPGVPIYRVVRRYGMVGRLGELLQEYKSFVIKPGRGAMGNGIIVVHRHEGGEYFSSGGSVYSLTQLQYHIRTILSGLYSLTQDTDFAILQQLVRMHEFFTNISFDGIPDVRVIVFRGYPVMAMLRLPTSESGGRANLHQGAIGAGVNLIDGKINHSIHHNRSIDRHPDTGATFEGLELPHWPEILDLAARCGDLTGLGYIGVDIVIDREMGPVCLELNARPGLAIQLANHLGLKRVLKYVEKLPAGLPVQKRLDMVAEITTQIKP